MKIAEEHLLALRVLGYTDCEARFLYLAATHSGCFVPRQFNTFADVNWGNRSDRFTSKLETREHATWREYLGIRSVYHLCSKDLYTRVGKGDLRYHRVHSIEFITRRLLQLDFIIANQQYDCLETENQKVSYFSEALGISKTALPVKTYARSSPSRPSLKGLTKRVRQPRALSVEELQSFWAHLDQDTRTMSMVDAPLGLRASELLGLRWEDFDWRSSRVKIQRSWVYGRVEAVKTEGSEKWLPLDPNLADILRRHREKMPDELLKTGWVFASPFTGKPWWAHKLVRYHLRPAAEKAGIGRIGWHTFRQTYSTLLHAHGTDMKVQQELLRHSDIRTTMNIYTHTVSPALREANSKVVRMILPEMKTA